MGRFIILLLTALVTFILILLVINPDLFNEYWMYAVGFAGVIIKGVKGLFEKISSGLKLAAAPGAITAPTGSGPPARQVPGLGTSPKKNENGRVADTRAEVPKDNFAGVTLTLLRYSDDGQTTLGLLYIDNKYFCVTLEDTFRQAKVRKETRIPAGVYEIRFRPEESQKTLEYRKRYPGWFKYHLELQNVPEFKYIYIHVGGNYMHTEGCILVSDSVSVSDPKTYLTNSARTFERLYNTVAGALNEGKKVRIVVKDEKWIQHINAA
ncbi:MAG TPA: DUF5675 family protein [Chryseosolibacter sp.]|nr:DUF5675 family protein [Chryseosolibacter sp.]